MDKAPDAFRTISEVADELDVPQHVLRFWESRFSQIRPMKRGGGRRYYRPDDVDLLRGIRHLLYGKGYTIRGVQRILREEGPKFVQSVWREGAPQPQRGDVVASHEVETDVYPVPAIGVGGEADDDFHDEDGDLPLPPLALAKAPEPPPPPPPRLRHEDRRRLETVLADLSECRRMLDAALTPV